VPAGTDAASAGTGMTPEDDLATVGGAGEEHSNLAAVVMTEGGALVRIGTTRRLRLAWQAATALAALHARRIAHGDVTAANVLLSSVDEEGKGGVRVVGYRHKASAVGTTTDDVYDWGVLAWQLLAGRTHHAGGVLASPGGWRATTIAAALGDRGVPPAVCETVLQCLAPNSMARPTMAAVARILAAALAADAARAAMGALASRTATAGDDAAALIGTAVAMVREYLRERRVVR